MGEAPGTEAAGFSYDEAEEPTERRKRIKSAWNEFAHNRLQLQRSEFMRHLRAEYERRMELIEARLRERERHFHMACDGLLLRSAWDFWFERVPPFRDPHMGWATEPSAWRNPGGWLTWNVVHVPRIWQPGVKGTVVAEIKAWVEGRLVRQ